MRQVILTRVLTAVKLRTTSSGRSRPRQPVSARTLAPGRSAPARSMTQLSCPDSPSTQNSRGVNSSNARGRPLPGSVRGSATSSAISSDPGRAALWASPVPVRGAGLRRGQRTRNSVAERSRACRGRSRRELSSRNPPCTRNRGMRSSSNPPLIHGAIDVLTSRNVDPGERLCGVDFLAPG